MSDPMGSIAAVIALTGAAHMVGDYLIQSHWMANNKTRHWWPAALHGVTYTLPFLLITQSPLALLVIGGTHAVIDRLSTRSLRRMVPKSVRAKRVAAKLGRRDRYFQFGADVAGRVVAIHRGQHHSHDDQRRCGGMALTAKLLPID